MIAPCTKTLILEDFEAGQLTTTVFHVLLIKTRFEVKEIELMGRGVGAAEIIGVLVRPWILYTLFRGRAPLMRRIRSALIFDSPVSLCRRKKSLSAFMECTDTKFFLASSLIKPTSVLTGWSVKNRSFLSIRATLSRDRRKPVMNTSSSQNACAACSSRSVFRLNMRSAAGRETRSVGPLA